MIHHDEGFIVFVCDGHHDMFPRRPFAMGTFLPWHVLRLFAMAPAPMAFSHAETVNIEKLNSRGSTQKTAQCTSPGIWCVCVEWEVISQPVYIDCAPCPVEARDKCKAPGRISLASPRCIMMMTLGTGIYMFRCMHTFLCGPVRNYLM